MCISHCRHLWFPPETFTTSYGIATPGKNLRLLPFVRVLRLDALYLYMYYVPSTSGQRLSGMGMFGLLVFWDCSNGIVLMGTSLKSCYMDIVDPSS